MLNLQKVCEREVRRQVMPVPGFTRELWVAILAARSEIRDELEAQR